MYSFGRMPFYMAVYMARISLYNTNIVLRISPACGYISSRRLLLMSSLVNGEKCKIAVLPCSGLLYRLRK